jgi:serine/threonine protein phosphatase PrpC
MEDAIAIVGDFAGSGTSYYAVFDSRGGPDVSRCAAHTLRRRLGTIFSSDVAVPKLFCGIFSDIDSTLRTKYGAQGSTAEVFAIIRDSIYTADVGDRRVILVETDGTIPQMTNDHRGSDPTERDLIVKRGGCVINGRAGEVLALRELSGKEDCISAEPFISTAKRRDG